MYGRPVSVGTLYHRAGPTGDRAGDCAAPLYRLCALYVVVTAAALGQRERPYYLRSNAAQLSRLAFL
jgi:hypothetical protein